MSNLWRSVRRWLPGGLISLAAIILILLFVDLNHFAQAIRSANVVLLATGFIMSFAWLGLRGMVWRTLLKGRAPYRDVFLTLCEGYLLNNFLPFRLGEIGRAFLLGRKSGLGFMEVLPTVIVERVLDLAFSAVILLSAVPFVIAAENTGRIALVVVGLIIAGLVVLFLLVRGREKILAWAGHAASRKPGLQKALQSFVEPLFSGFAILADGRLFARSLFWMSLNWGLAILQFYILILAFFPQAQLTWSLFGLGAVAFGNAIPSLPGAVGTFEGAFGGALTILSGDQSTALAAALVVHLINYVTTGVIGLYALSTEGETLLGIYRQLRKRQGEQEAGS